MAEATGLGKVDLPRTAGALLVDPALAVLTRSVLRRGVRRRLSHGLQIEDRLSVPRDDGKPLWRLGVPLSGLPSKEIEQFRAADHDARVLADSVRHFVQLRPGAVGAMRRDVALWGAGLVSTVARARLLLGYLGERLQLYDDLNTADASGGAHAPPPSSRDACYAERPS